MRYVEARIDEFYREQAYRVYITTSLRLIPQNKFISSSYQDILAPKNTDKLNANDIINDIISRAELKFGE